MSPHIILLACIFELHNILINLAYLNRIYSTSGSFSHLGINTNVNNFFFFFNKIKKLSKVFKNISFKNKKIKSWKSLIVFFLVSVNAFLSKKYFADFNFNVKLTNNNLPNYFAYNRVSLFKIKKRPSRFTIFYFFIFIFKMFLSTKHSLYILKNYVYLDFDFLLLFSLVKERDHINHKFRYLIYI